MRKVDDYYQDKDESVARTFDWSADLNGSTISGAPVWAVPAVVTKAAESNTTTTATARFSGSVGVHRLECTATTAAGEILQAYALLHIED